MRYQSRRSAPPLPGPAVPVPVAVPVMQPLLMLLPLTTSGPHMLLTVPWNLTTAHRPPGQQPMGHPACAVGACHQMLSHSYLEPPTLVEPVSSLYIVHAPCAVSSPATQIPWIAHPECVCKFYGNQMLVKGCNAYCLHASCKFSNLCSLQSCHLTYGGCRIFQQQFCQLGKPVVVRGIKPGFLWDPDTLQRATVNLKGMYGKRLDKSAARVKQKTAKPLTVSPLPPLLFPLPCFPPPSADPLHLSSNSC